MPLHFVRPRLIADPAPLTPTEAKQLRAFGRLYDGKDVAAEDRFEASQWMHGSKGQTLFARGVELWAVDRDGEHVYDAWLYSDSGTVFEKGTTREVAMRIQGGFTTNHLPANPGLIEEIAAAYQAAPRLEKRKKTLGKKRRRSR